MPKQSQTLCPCGSGKGFYNCCSCAPHHETLSRERVEPGGAALKRLRLIGDKLLAAGRFGSSFGNGAVLPNEYQAVLSRMSQLTSLHFPGSELALYGSIASGFWSSTSDIDVSLMVSTVHTGQDVIAALELLSEVFVSLGLCCTHRRFRAIVPVIKLEDRSRGLSMDLSVNNILAIQNSELLRRYSSCDRRVHPLVMLIKDWAKSNSEHSHSVEIYRIDYWN